ncbi:MAG TPA: hypothetical protein VF600_13055 [Abditibacteriaceae bacterium]|jgi:hypothetical protein
MSGVPLWTWLIGALFVAALLHGLWQLGQRKTAFRQIAQELGGSCIENTLTAQVVVPTAVGKLTLDTFTSWSRGDTPKSTTYTRLRLPLVALQPFEFTLMSRTPGTQLLMQMVQSPLGQLATVGSTKAQESLHVLRLNEIALGDSAFDRSFILKSPQEMQAKQLFAQVKEHLPKPYEFVLILQPYSAAASSHRTQTMVLHYQEKGVATDVAHLRNVCDLLQHLAQELQRRGIASNEKAQVASPLAL